MSAHAKKREVDNECRVFNKEEESCDVREKTQQHIFLCGITADFHVMEELAAMPPMKGRDSH